MSETSARPLRRPLIVDDRTYEIVDLPRVAGGAHVLARLPVCIRIMLENVARNLGRGGASQAHLEVLSGWTADATSAIEVPFHPVRVLMQDYTGIPALVDLAALRDATIEAGAGAGAINPVIPVDIVIDHSLIVDEAGHRNALRINLEAEIERNRERYALAKWAEQAFASVRVVPPGFGVVHQINIEKLATVIGTAPINGTTLAFPDTMVGADSHSTMVNGLGVLGWGVGGIEAEAAMLGLPLVLPLLKVVGVRLSGRLQPGILATDLVLTITKRLRNHGVVDCLVEFFGPAVAAMPVTDRVTIANMAPDYGATCALFPIDAATIHYLRATGRDEDAIALVEAYARAQGLWWQPDSPEPDYSSVVDFDLSTVAACAAGPRRPQDTVALPAIPANFRTQMEIGAAERHALDHGSVVIAAITSCTNTSNPTAMIAAGLLARNAVERGLRPKPWVKTSLTPGSRVVGDYLAESGLQAYLDTLGFHVAGYGCATCGGFSGSLAPAIEREISERALVTAAVLSGNRNFEARIHPLARANYLMSPPLVVAYALAGSMLVDLTSDPLGEDQDGNTVGLEDIWPSETEIGAVLTGTVSPELYRARYGDMSRGSPEWHAIPSPTGTRYAWDTDSSYVIRPVYFDDDSRQTDIAGARQLLLLGDSVTTDHISPVSNIAAASPAGLFLVARGVAEADFNTYGARRTNHEVMIRGTFANIRLQNEIVPDRVGGFTRHFESGEILTVYEAAMRYQVEGTPLVVIGGKEYGTGSARDWAAKGTRLLGVRAVIAESYERIHRANLAAMGVLPLEFQPGTTRRTIGLDGSERIDVLDIAGITGPRVTVNVRAARAEGGSITFPTICRLDTLQEVEVWRSGGILPFILERAVRGTATGR